MTRIAIVTGATSGFGAACARKLVGQGYSVIATGRRAERLDDLVRELGGKDKVHPLAFDMRDPAAIAAAIAGLPAAFAGVDLLVNNAGLALGIVPAQQAALDDWQTMIETNVTGLVTITKALLPTLIAQKGAIINISSIAANWPYPGGNVYGATKAFVKQFSLGLRSDLQGTGVRVTSVEPGLAESEFTLVRTGGDKTANDKLYEGADPLKPEDIAETVCWIAGLPAHMNVNTIEVMPTSQAWGALQIARRG